MPYLVELPDGRRVEFPDSVSKEEAARVIREQLLAPPREEPERTIGGYAKEAVKGLLPGAVSGIESAITGAASILPEEAEQAIRRPVSGFAERVREALAPEAGYEDTAVRKLSEAVGSTAPFLGAGLLGAAGRAAAVGLGVATGAGEARQRAEAEEATEGERGVATALGIAPGALESLPPIRILRRLGFGDEALAEIAKDVPALRRVAAAGGEEALQEASSQVLQNAIAKGVYKPEEELLGGVGEAAALGGGAGAIISAIAELAIGRRGARAAPPTEEPPPEEELKALPPPRVAGYEIDSQGNVVREITEAEAETRSAELARLQQEGRYMGLGESEAIQERMREGRRRSEEAELRRRPLGEADQIGLGLEGGEARPDTLLEPPVEPRPQMFISGEEALTKAIEQRQLETGEQIRPRSRAYREEAKDLGVRLDRKGEVKPNQAVFEQPEALKYQLIYTDKTGEQVSQTFDTIEQQQKAYEQVLDSGVPESKIIRRREEAPKEQMGFNLPGVPMERLVPRDRVLRAMAITEIEQPKTKAVLQAETGLKPAELSGALFTLKGEGAISFNNKTKEWELTPAGVENVRTGRKPEPRRRRAGVSVPVQQRGAAAAPAEGVEPLRVAGTGADVARVDEREEPSESALAATPPAPPAPPVDRMELIRRAQQERNARVARQAIDEFEARKSALRTQAIDAFDADQIGEPAYEQINEELKKTNPNLGLVQGLLSGTVKPKRKPKYQRVEEPATYAIINTRDGKVVGTAKTLKGARLAKDRRDNQYGAYVHKIQVVSPEADIAQRQQLRAELGVESLETPAPRTTVLQRGKTGAGLPVERVQTAAVEATRNWANPPRVVVATSAADPAIPEQYRNEIPKDAPGFYVDGTTYVIADRAKDEAGVRGTVFHESLGHYGLEQEFQDGLHDVMRAIYKTNPQMKAAADERIKKFNLDPATAVEEVLAERSEAGPIKDAGIRATFNRVVAWIRNWLRSKGLVSAYSDNDISQILQQAHRRVTELKKAPYDPFNPAIRYQRSPEAQRKGDIAFINKVAKIPESGAKATEELLESARNATSNMPPKLRRAWFSMLTPHNFDQMYGKYTKSFGNLWNALNEEGVALRKREDAISENAKKWNELMSTYSPAERDRIYKLMLDTTVEQIEVLNLTDKTRGVEWQAKKDHPLYKSFMKLDAPVRKMYEDLRLAYLDYALGVENSLKQYLTPTEWQKIKSELNARRLPVYLPLFRSGDYKLTYKDKDNQYVSRLFNSRNERNKAAEEVRRQGAKDIQISMREDFDSKAVPPSGFVGEIVGLLRKKDVDEGIVQQVFETYMDYLPVNSVLQLSRKREATPGFELDILQAYANVAGSYARKLSNMELEPKLREFNEQFKTDMAIAVDEGKIDPDLVSDLKTIANKQLDYIRNPNLNNLSAKVGYFSYTMFLGANISTAIVNTLDIPTITLSRLGGKHGFARSTAALTQAGKLFFSKNKPKEIQELLQRGLDSGVVREQKLRDLAEFKNLDSSFERIKAGTDRVINWAFAKSDLFNREVALIAAYQLAKNKALPDGQFDEAAFKEAQRTVYDVYGSSFPKAGPPIMGNGLARTALTFKRFAITRMWLLGTAFKEAAKGESKEVRDAARKELIGYFGTAYVFAGMQGMPVVGAGMTIVSMLNAILGDDDEPYNPEFAMREAVGLFNYKGPVNYAFGVDIASRTGWTGMFWREDPKRLAEVGPVTYVVEQALGPAYSYAVGVPRAIELFSEGQGQRAFEQLAPRVFSNISKGIRYAQDGAVTADGTPLVENVDAYNVFMQLFGFRPSDVAETGEEAGAAKRMESKIFERRNAIIARAALAQMAGDGDGFAEAIQEAAEFSSKNPTVAISPKVIRRAIERRYKKMAESVNGVRVNPKLATSIYEELGIDPFN